MGQPPETTSSSPVAVGADKQLALGMMCCPVLEQEQQVLYFLVGKGRGCLVLEALLFGLGFEEGSGVGDGVEKGREIGGHDVGYKPWDGLGVEDDTSGQPGGKEVSRKNQVSVEFKASIVENKVDLAFLLAGISGLLEQFICCRDIISEDVLLGGLSSLGSLKSLYIVVGKSRQQG